MNRPDSLPAITLTKAFEAFLESASFARRTRESYADDLAPLLTQYGQADVFILTTAIIQAYLARLPSLRMDRTWGQRRWPAPSLRSMLGTLPGFITNT